MKTQIPRVALASLFLLCATSRLTQAAPIGTPPTSVTLTSGMFTTTINTDVVVDVVNIGGPGNGPVTIESSIVDYFNTVIVSHVWTIPAGMSAATSADFSTVRDVRAVVRILDQRQRPLVKPTAELINLLESSTSFFAPIIYIPSTEFTPVP